MGKHSRPEDTTVMIYRGYKCEGCEGFWAVLQPEDAEPLENPHCRATAGCEGFVVALMPVDEPPPDWVPVIFPGGVFNG